MSGGIHVMVSSHQGGSLFSAEMEAVPRVGEFISYSHEAHDPEKWNEDSLSHSRQLNGWRWRVVEVHHSTRRMSVMNATTTIHLVVEAVKGRKK
ncbi:hypothetical protein [Piscinibacter gummiphilus]|uniref:MATH domain-containing protein n=1 Tax=Piscinibacter gummiphilus TaxID=946333 RepID=A0ABZ0CNH3_9BURK|nr:hypothetical protein [Piscinibacter gummiphilus]WOB06547.1 hypothetical protein RXV79_16630 [Piscinibacter gummiphilus]